MAAAHENFAHNLFVRRKLMTNLKEINLQFLKLFSSSKSRTKLSVKTTPKQLKSNSHNELAHYITFATLQFIITLMIVT